MLQVRLLGQFDIRSDGKRVVIPRRAGQSLFAYLVLTAGVAHRRERLAGLFWPDVVEESARRNLRQELWRVRKALTTQSAADADQILAEELLITFNPAPDFWFDVAQLERMLFAGSPVDERINQIALYQGELLPGFYDDWVSLERERVQAIYEDRMRVLLEELVAGKHWSSAVSWAEKWISLGQMPEAAFRALMLTYGMLGDSAKVVATFERCKTVLHDDLDVEPSEETVNLYQQLMRGETIARVSLVTPRILPGAKAAMHEETPVPGEPPFKGLEFFDEGDAALFFGREELTAKLVQALQDSKFLAVVVGASGSGKSSLVRAGIVPALKKGTSLTDGTLLPPESLHWATYIFTPTARPLEALATTLTRDNDSVLAAATLIDDLTKDPRALHLWLRRMRRSNTNADEGRTTNGEIQKTNLRPPSAFVIERTVHRHFLLVIDQFEELFTLCHDEFEREAFIDNLLTALSYGEDGHLTIVLTIRADFYAHFAQYPELRDAVAKHQEFIGPMTSQELRRAIEEPARHAGWEFEPGLVDLILRDVGDEPGALPLLSHALLETWKRRSGRTLTLKGYHDASGVRGAIAQTAENVYQQFTPHEQELAREIFLRLTELGQGTEDTRRRASFDELIPRDETSASVHAVLVRLADARLLTLHAHSAEVAHEALIREWPQLREWLNQDRDGLRLHRHLTEAAQEWAMLERDPEALYRGARLAQAQEYAASNPQRLNALERAFLIASAADAERAEREREEQRARELAQAQTLAQEQTRRLQDQAAANKRLRRRAFILATVGVLALLAAGAAVFFLNLSNANLQAATEQRAEANLQRDAAQKGNRLAMARELAANALTNLGVDAQRSVLLALQAVKTTQEEDKIVLPEAENALRRSVLASRIQLTLGPGEEHVVRTVYSPDGSQIATRAISSIRVWDARTGKALFHVPMTSLALGLRLQAARGWDNVVYSSDGAQLATIDPDAADGRVLWAKVFDARSGKLVRQTKIPMPRDEWAASDFTSDLGKVVVGSTQSIGEIWDTRTGERLVTLTGNQPSVLAVTYSPDEKRIVISSLDGSTKVWDAATGKELLNLCCHLQPVFGATFSPDGSRIATASADGTAKIWDANTGKELMTLSGPEEQITNVAFSPDGKYIAGPTWDYSTFIWDSETGNQLYILAGHTNVVEDASFSPDGKHIVTASDDGSALVWDAEPSHEVSALATAPIWRSAISKDGNRLATRHAESEFIVWDLERRQPLLTFFDPDAHQVDVQATLAISPDGKRVLYATGNSVRVWDVASGRQFFNLTPTDKDLEPSFVGVPAFSPDGKRILGTFDYPQAPTGVERHALIWDSMSGTQLADFSIAMGDLIGGAIAMSPDETRLVVSDSSGAVRVFDARSGESLSEQYNDSFVVHVAISPDGKQYAEASIDGTAVVRDMATGQVLFPPLRQSATIYQLEYSPDGKYISTAGFDGVAKVWDADTGKELHSLQGSPAQVRAAHFNADATHLITAGMDGVIREYTLQIQDLVKLAKARLTRTWTLEECQKFLHVESCPAPK